MTDIREEIAKILSPHIDGMTEEEIKQLVEVPADTSHGDYAFPCFKLAKLMRKAPPLIAAELAEKIKDAELFESVEPINAFLNMFISREFFTREVLSEVLSEADRFGGSGEGGGKTVIVEFSSPNIAKPFHIGHIRTTVIGNSLYKIFDFLGYKVVRMNHLGDYGTQFGKMITAYRHWGSREEVEAAPIKTLLAYYVRFHEEEKNDPSLTEEAREAFAALERGEKEEKELWQWIRDESLKEFKRVYDMLDIDFDSWAGESFYSDKMPRFINELKEKGLLIESQGAQIVDLEAYGMSPAMITKSDGSSLYVTRDIAAAVYRKETYDFYKCIYVVASQQNLHFRQWKQVLELMGYTWQKDCIHVPFGLVSLEDGVMSTRRGHVVFLEDVLNTAVEKTAEIMRKKNAQGIDIDEVSKEVGIGAVIFQELSNNRIKDYTFSWDKVTNFDGETGPYVQYTHARASSVLRNAAPEELEAIRNGSADWSYLESDSAYALIKLLYRVPEIVLEAADKYEPSIVTRHLVDIAQAFNKFYHDEHILVDNKDEKLAKLSLVLAAKTVIANCLGLLGIKAPERM